MLFGFLLCSPNTEQRWGRQAEQSWGKERRAIEPVCKWERWEQQRQSSSSLSSVARCTCSGEQSPPRFPFSSIWLVWLRLRLRMTLLWLWTAAVLCLVVSHLPVCLSVFFCSTTASSLLWSVQQVVAECALTRLLCRWIFAVFFELFLLLSTNWLIVTVSDCAKRWSSYLWLLIVSQLFCLHHTWTLSWAFCLCVFMSNIVFVTCVSVWLFVSVVFSFSAAAAVKLYVCLISWVFAVCFMQFFYTFVATFVIATFICSFLPSPPFFCSIIQLVHIFLPFFTRKAYHRGLRNYASLSVCLSATPSSTFNSSVQQYCLYHEQTDKQRQCACNCQFCALVLGTTDRSCFFAREQEFLTANFTFTSLHWLLLYWAAVVASNFLFHFSVLFQCPVPPVWLSN